MDLWIKSQDKELLVNAKGFELQQHYKDSPCQIFAVWNNNYNCVGTYKTKERALEVLDEIEERIMIINTISLVKDSVSLIAYKNALSEEKIKGIGYPYQMPKE